MVDKRFTNEVKELLVSHLKINVIQNPESGIQIQLIWKDDSKHSTVIDTANLS